MRLRGWDTVFGPMDIREPARLCRAGEGAPFAIALVCGPPIDALGPGAAVLVGAGGGAIDCGPVVLSLDFALESDVRAVAGVPVRGVDAAELAEETAFVGDLVGDCVLLA